MEAAHAELHEASNAGDPLLSLSLRTPEVTRRMAVSPEVLPNLAACFEVTRRIRGFAETFPGQRATLC